MPAKLLCQPPAVSIPESNHTIGTTSQDIAPVRRKNNPTHIAGMAECLDYGASRYIPNSCRAVITPGQDFGVVWSIGHPDNLCRVPLERFYGVTPGYIPNSRCAVITPS